MYERGVAIVRWALRLIFGLEVTGLENIPREGGAVVASNHTTWFDPVAVACALDRPVHFMAKAELFRNPLVARFLRKVYAFPVRRGARIGMLSAAIQVAGEGNLWASFPRDQGPRRELLPLQSGAVFIAAKAGVPIVPVAVAGLPH